MAYPFTLSKSAHTFSFLPLQKLTHPRDMHWAEKEVRGEGVGRAATTGASWQCKGLVWTKMVKGKAGQGRAGREGQVRGDSASHKNSGSAP